MESALVDRSVPTELFECDGPQEKGKHVECGHASVRDTQPELVIRRKVLAFGMSAKHVI